MSSEAEITANLERGVSTLQAAKILLTSGFPNDAASRAYYAAFHAATALLLSKNLSFGSHAGVLRAINLNFVKTGQLPRDLGRDLNWLAELRQIADYGELRNISMTDAQKGIEIAEQVLHYVQRILDEQ
ncbi:HEPN domain-containing protein [Halomicronema sp. CCY15110]|uniref:HEPN domain-containing protein n=1 Tax=Halomicronema sp. CCY15110 TaxID=2767773 RepID=UPI00194E16BE|nr:HEPN domain-containing protein [Halomicronema sp. CCY15110]